MHDNYCNLNRIRSFLKRISNHYEASKTVQSTLRLFMLITFEMSEPTKLLGNWEVYLRRRYEEFEFLKAKILKV